MQMSLLWDGWRIILTDYILSLLNCIGWCCWPTGFQGKWCRRGSKQENRETCLQAEGERCKGNIRKQRGDFGCWDYDKKSCRLSPEERESAGLCTLIRECWSRQWWTGLVSRIGRTDGRLCQKEGDSCGRLTFFQNVPGHRMTYRSGDGDPNGYKQSIVDVRRSGQTEMVWTCSGELDYPSSPTMRKCQTDISPLMGTLIIPDNTDVWLRRDLQKERQ